jgi:hypothetical protein
VIVSGPGEQDPDVNRGANRKGAELEDLALRQSVSVGLHCR